MHDTLHDIPHGTTQLIHTRTYMARHLTEWKNTETYTAGHTWHDTHGFWHLHDIVRCTARHTFEPCRAMHRNYVVTCTCPAMYVVHCTSELCRAMILYMSMYVVPCMSCAHDKVCRDNCVGFTYPISTRYNGVLPCMSCYVCPGVYVLVLDMHYPTKHVLPCMSYHACPTLHVLACMSYNVCHWVYVLLRDINYPSMHVPICMSNHVCLDMHVNICMSSTVCPAMIFTLSYHACLAVYVLIIMSYYVHRAMIFTLSYHACLAVYVLIIMSYYVHPYMYVLPKPDNYHSIHVVLCILTCISCYVYRSHDS